MLSKAINGDTNPTVQVIEDGGVPVYIGLLKPDLMKQVCCTFGDDRCMVDRSQNCDKSGVMYSIQCNTCEALVEDDRETSCYIGMTQTTLHNRMLGHLKDQRIRKVKVCYIAMTHSVMEASHNVTQ